jgi:hypothetical protein
MLISAYDAENVTIETAQSFDAMRERMNERKIEIEQTIKRAVNMKLTSDECSFWIPDAMHPVMVLTFGWYR